MSQPMPFEVEEEEDLYPYEKEKACFFVPPEFPVRVFCMWLIRWIPFIALIIVSILVNTGMLGAFDPLNPASARNAAINTSEYIFLVIFAIEAVAKLIAMGVVGHKGAYFRDAWNWLDFLIVVLSLVSVLPGVGGNYTSIRALRILRTLRLINFIPQLRVQIETLLHAAPDLLNAFLFLIILFLIFGIIGLQVFRGVLRQHCVDPVTGLYDTEVTCALNYSGQGFDCARLVDNPNSVCQITPLNPRYNQISFDNIGLALVTVFQVVSPEDWSIIAVLCMDATSTAAIIYFVALIIAGTLILVNLFVAVVAGVLDRESKLLKEENKKSRVTQWVEDKWEAVRLAERHRDRNGFLKFMHTVVDSTPFIAIMYIFIALNFIALCMEHYPAAPGWSQALDILNILFNSVFTFEIICKLIGLGLHLWASDGLNVFDFLIVAVSWVEIGIGGITIVRTLRTFRLFRLLTVWPAFNRILKTVGLALKGSIWFLVLLCLYIYIFAVTGMQTFGGHQFFVDGYARSNFDTLWWAIMSVFIVIGGDNWPAVMADGIRAIGWSAAVYFIVLFAVGAWILLQLFLAILLGAFDEEHEEEEAEEARSLLDADDRENKEDGPRVAHPDPLDHAVTGTEVAVALSSKEAAVEMDVLKRFQSPTEEPKLFQEDKDKKMTREEKARMQVKAMEEQQRMLKEHEQKIEAKRLAKAQVPEGKSFYIFSETNVMRRAMFELVRSDAFEGFILCSILLSCIILAMDNYYWDRAFTWQVFLFGAELCFMVIFGFEMVFKTIAYGFVGGKRAYLRNGWNILDFGVVLVSLLSIVLSLSIGINIAFLRGFRAFRAFRVLGRFKTTRITVLTMLKSLPAVVNVVVFSMILWLIGAIMGVQLFAGRTALCNDSTVVTRMQCVGQFLDPATGMLADRLWQDRIWGNFNNLGMALYSLFPVIGVSGWVQKMNDCVDIVGVDLQPRLNEAPAYALYYVLFIIVCAWFNGNLLTGAIADTFKQLNREHRRDGVLLTERQEQWIDLQKSMMRTVPRTTYKIPSHPFREYVYRFVINKYFTFFIAAVIMVNIVVLCMEYQDMPLDYERGLQITNACFMGIFFVEMVLKMIAMGLKTYFTEGWTILDFVIVIGSLVDVFLTFLSSTFFSLSVIRVFRVFAILKLIKWSKRLRMMMRTLLISIPPVINVLSLWGIITFVYAVIGVAVFGSAQEGESLYNHATFKEFGSAVYILLRIVTGESWEDLMFDLYNPPNNLLGSPAYFYSYLVFCAMLMLEVVVGIILDLFSNNYFVAEEDVSADSADNFTGAWAKQDPLGTLFVQVHQLPDLLSDIEPPLGPGPLEREHLIRFVSRLPLPIRKDSEGEDSIYYGDLLRTLLQMAAPVGLNDPRTIQKLERKWFSRFPHLKPLPGGKEYTVKHYVAAIKLQRAFRARLRGNSMGSAVNRPGELGKKKDHQMLLFDDVFVSKSHESEMRASQLQDMATLRRTVSGGVLQSNNAVRALRKSSSRPSSPIMSRRSPVAGKHERKGSAPDVARVPIAEDLPMRASAPNIRRKPSDETKGKEEE